MQQTFVERAKSITGMVLIGLGIFLFYENLHQAATQFSHFLSGISSKALGVLPTAILGASRHLEAHGANRHQALQGSLLHMLAPSWPLLLVLVGAVLSLDHSTNNVNALPKKDCGLVDLNADRSTSRGEVRLLSIQKEK